MGGSTVRILGSLLSLLMALLIMFLLGSSFLISSDWMRGDLYDKYRNDKSFLYRLGSGATVHIRYEGNPRAHPRFCCTGLAPRFMLGIHGSTNWAMNFA